MAFAREGSLALSTDHTYMWTEHRCEAARRAHNVLVRLTSVAPTLPDEAEPLVVDDSTIEIPDLPREPHVELFRSSTHGFVDYSEDVSSEDLYTAVREGYDPAELAKRYTTATMGPLRGKLEILNVVAGDRRGQRRNDCRDGHHGLAAALRAHDVGCLGWPSPRPRALLPDARLA